MRLKEKWQAIIATAGAASRKTMGRSGPVVSAPAAGVEAISGGLSGVACYQHERVATAAHQIDERLARMPVDRGDRGVRGGRRFLPVPQAVHDGQQRPLPHALDETEIARLGLPRHRQRGERRLDLQMLRRHFIMVMVVPRPTTESTSNSSINRLAPGKPA